MSVSQWLDKVAALVLTGLLTWAAQTSAAENPAPAMKDGVPQVGLPGKDVVWMPKAKSVMDKMFEIAKLTPQDVLYDLGSGDGRVVIAAARAGATAVGIEYNPKLVELARGRAAKEGVSAKASFLHGDIFQSDLSKATVITLFLLPELNLKLRPVLLNLKPGTRVTANSFDMGDWKPDRFERLKGDCESWCMAFLWIVPAKVEGAWQMTDGELILRQQYQTITGTMRMRDRTFTIANGRLAGEEIFFDIGGVRVTGRVSGNAMKGAMVAKTGQAPWEARRREARSPD